MAIVLKDEKRPITLSSKLSAYFFGLSFLFGCLLVLFHFLYERQYKRESLNHTLEQNALLIYNYLQKKPLDSLESLASLMDKDLRITLISPSGEVLYDNSVLLERLDNHLDRPEVREATQKGEGSYIRHSPTNQIKYYYYAKRFDTYYVRAALPYTAGVGRLISPGYFFIVVTFTLLCLFAAVMFIMKSRIGKRLIDTQLEKERLIRQELTQNLSHELKTPVSSILGYMETLVLNPNLEPEKVRFFIERSHVQTLRLGQLIEDISLLNRLDHAPDRFPFEAVDIYEVIENAVKDVSLQLSERNIKVELPSHTKILLTGNSSLLYSVFRNLLDNAITYAGTDVTITISCTDKGDEFLYFSFADDGPGVESKHLPHLFDRFYRIDSGRSRKQGGTGLGLSIVKNGIMAHGGTIEAFHEGGGLTFLFRLKK